MDKFSQQAESISDEMIRKLEQEPEQLTFAERQNIASLLRLAKEEEHHRSSPSSPSPSNSVLDKEKSEKQDVGFIGVGTMGKHMAHNLLKNGFSVTVCDRDVTVMNWLASEGASTSSSPIQTFKNSKVLLLCLPTASHVESVLFDPQEGIFGPQGCQIQSEEEKKIIVDCSTTNMETAIRISSRLEKLNVHFLDAPMSGMASRAQDASLCFMVGGPPSDVHSVLPLLNSMGSQVAHMGTVGFGQAAKMINNVIFNSNIAVLAEVLTLGGRLGLSPESLVQVVNASSGGSFASKTFLEHVLQGDFHSGYPLISAQKDMTQFHELTKDLPSSILSFSPPPSFSGAPIFSSVNLIYQTAIDEGFGKCDKAAMFQVYEKKFGVLFRRPT